VFESRVLRRMFGPKRDEVTGEWRKLRQEKLSDLYCSPSIIWVIRLRRMRWVDHIAPMGRGEACSEIVMGKPEGKRPVGRNRHRWENYIKMDVNKVGDGGIQWIELAQDRGRWRALVNAVIIFLVP
jgi:hypothetical protein